MVVISHAISIYLFMFVLFSTLSCGWCANIVGIFAMPFYSHYLLGHRILEELCLKGHRVTMIAPFKQNQLIDNYTQIYLDGFIDRIKEKQPLFLEMEDMNVMYQIMEFYNLGYMFTNETLKHASISDFLKSNDTFDLVIMDQYLNEGLLGIVEELKAPLVYLNCLGSSIWSNHLVGNTAPLTYIPNFHLDYKGNMGIFQRSYNFCLYILEEIYRTFAAFPHHNQLLHESFPKAPDLYDLLYKRDAFMLVNSHVSILEPMPHVPSMIEIGGFHIKDEQDKLPEELQTFLDNATEGVIYVAFGSNIQIASLPVEKRAALIKALGRFKQKVILKWEDNFIPDQPENIKFANWFPQQTILAHKNVKCFISHGGLLSVMESVHFAVPIVGIPLYSDQKMNINLAVKNGHARLVPFKQLNEENLQIAVNEILDNEVYKRNAVRRSTLFKDRMIRPMEEAIYWIEYVIRNKGSKLFRSGAMDVKWYQFGMIDVILFIGVLSSLFLGFNLGLCVAFAAFASSFYKCDHLKREKEKQKNRLA